MSGYPRVIGVDPGFASIGYAVVRIEPEFEVVEALGVIRTEKSDAKRNVMASDDNLRRAREIYEAVRGILTPSPFAICAETMSFPRNSGAAAKVAMCWGVIASLSAEKGIPVVQASPQEIKKVLCGARGASKEEVQEAVLKRYPENVVLRELTGIIPSQREHAFDAVAAVVACLKSDVMRVARSKAA